MSKPSIFFSHSSRDGELLSVLKDQIMEKTGGSFDIFLSSDGQSIPFGTNWVYAIQEALEETQAVFVFVSPQSIQSGWVYFEAGYAYSKKKNVVPVGLFGTQIGLLPPPLGLLNGFDLDGADGANKLMGTINEILGHDHKYRFSQLEFASIFQRQSERSNSAFSKVVETIYATGRSEAVAEDVKHLTFDFDRPVRAIARIRTLSEENGWPCSSRLGSSAAWAGMELLLFDAYEENFRFSILGAAFEQCLPILESVMESGIQLSIKELKFSIFLQSHLVIERDVNFQSFSLQGTEAEINPKGGFQFRSLQFELIAASYDIDPATIKINGSRSEIRVRANSDHLIPLDIVELIGLLMEHRLIKVQTQ
tara:strand:+ start:957 stop:2051 length:1095 start_codon:yes stop_codon:yes gene_type:complete